jgi:hypothetical protein
MVQGFTPDFRPDPGTSHFRVNPLPLAISDILKRGAVEENCRPSKQPLPILMHVLRRPHRLFFSTSSSSTFDAIVLTCYKLEHCFLRGNWDAPEERKIRSALGASIRNRNDIFQWPWLQAELMNHIARDAREHSVILHLCPRGLRLQYRIKPFVKVYTNVGQKLRQEINIHSLKGMCFHCHVPNFTLCSYHFAISPRR